MNACSNSDCHETGTRENPLPAPTPAGQQSGRVVTAAKAVENNLSAASDLQPQDDGSQARTLSAQSIDKPANGRQILRERFDKIDHPEHFAIFCAKVEEIYVQGRFHCTLDQLPGNDMARIVLENYNTLSDLVTLTSDPTAGESGDASQQLAVVDRNYEKNQAARSTKTRIHHRLRVLYPWYNNSNLQRLTAYLSRDCQQVKGCQLSELTYMELLTFSKNQIKTRTKLQNGEIRQQIDPERLSENEMLLLFSTQIPQPPKSKKTTEYLTIPKRLYRVGTFTSNEDEMGRAKNHKLKRPIFEQSQVNQQEAKFGAGLYATQNATHCRKYRRKRYNLNKPLAILEMTTGTGINLVDYKNAFEHSGRRLTDSNDKQGGTIVKTAPGELLVKDSGCIVSTKAFHPSMMTKVHIPFTREEILTHQLQRKTITPDDFARLEHTKTLHCCPIADTQGLEAGVRNVLECRVCISPEQGSARGLTCNKWHELKFYANSLTSPNLVQVKPAAPLNRAKKTGPPETACDHDLNMDYEFMEFHVQYHQPGQSAKSEDKPKS